MCTSYRTVISNKEELDVFLLLEDGYTLVDMREEQIKASFLMSSLSFRIVPLE